MEDSKPSSYGAVDAGDKDAHLLKASGNSAALTAGIIIADVVGAGILSMAVAVAHLGWVLGAVAICLLLAMNVHVSILMWRVRMHFPEAGTYCKLVDCAFSKASPFQRSFASNVTAVTQYLFILCMLGLYTLSAGRGLGNLFYDVHWCLPTWSMVATGMLLPFHLTARRLGKWKSLIYMNVATIVGTTAIPLIFMWHLGVENTRPLGSSHFAVAELNVAGTFAALSTFTFAFTSQFMVTEIIAEMEDPAEFPKAYIGMAAPFQFFAFMAVGMIGYYYMGDGVAGMIGDNIPFGPTFQLAAFCLVSHMLITYLIKGIVICRAFHGAWDKEAVDSDDTGAWSTWSIIVVTTVAIAYTLSQLVPFFSDAVDFLGASFTPVACYMIPIALYLRWYADFGETSEISKFELAVIGFEFLFAVVLCIAGTYFSASTIIEKWETYGGPFECHCEGMWKTCDCSGDHAGMLETCKAVLMHFHSFKGPL